MPSSQWGRDGRVRAWTRSGALAVALAACISIVGGTSALASTPTVSLTGVGSGQTVSGKLTLGASASDSSGVDQVKWYVDNREVGWDGDPSWQVGWDSASVGDGSHTAFAKAADPQGNWGTSEIITFKVANTQSLGQTGVAVTAPADGSTVSGTTTLAASASDPSGITQVKWFVDGLEVGWDGAAPWSAGWNSAGVSNGWRSIYARAQTGQGQWITSPTEWINVQNQVGSGVSSKWRLLMTDNFDGSSLDTTKWRVYGPNWRGHNGNGLRDGRAVSVQNGTLTITAQMINGTLVSGGVASRIEQRYGRYEFRARADPDWSEAMSAVVLTWPESNNFPIDGENDIWETLHNNPDRYPLHSFIHYGWDNRQYWFDHYVDGTQWQHMAMEWEPNQIRIYRNGALVWTLTDTNAIPDVAHHLCAQLDAFKTWVSGSPRMQVDDVRIYERAY